MLSELSDHLLTGGFLYFLLVGEKMKVLVTGAGGYIGKHVVNVLRQHPIEIIACDLCKNFEYQNCCCIGTDILKNAEDKDLFKKLGSPEAVIHLAWQDGFNHKAESHIKNLYSHYLFLKNMAEHGCRNISVLGTMHEVGYYEGAIDEKTPCFPLSYYGIAKNTLRQIMEVYCAEQQVSLKWLRAFYILGDDERSHSVFSKIIEFEKEGKETFPFTSGLNKYDFIAIDKLGELIVKAALQTEIKGIINVCSGKAVSLRDKVEEFIKDHHFKIRPQYGAYPSRPYDSPAIWGDITKLNKILAEE